MECSLICFQPKEEGVESSTTQKEEGNGAQAQRRGERIHLFDGAAFTSPFCVVVLLFHPLSVVLPFLLFLFWAVSLSPLVCWSSSPFQKKT